VSYMLDLLNEMRRRPIAIYVGRTSLSKLSDFLHGYDYAVWRLGVSEKDSLLEEFRDWIQHRFGTTKKSWEELIRLDSTTEEGAVKRFWELLDEFLQQRQGAGTAPSAPPFPDSQAPGLAAPAEGRSKV